MHTPSLEEYMQRIYRGDWDGVGELMLESAAKLEKAGCDFLICPDNTLHQALPYVVPRSPLPWLHIADAVMAEANAAATARSAWRHALAHGGAGLSLRPRRPATADREEMNRVIMDELVRSVSNRGRGVFQRVYTHEGRGCDAVVMGCTEIPLVMNDGDSPLPTLDSTRLLARAALRRAVNT